MVNVEPIRAGVIGYGIGKLYTAALKSARLYYPDLPPVDLVAVATSSEAGGRKAMEQAGFERFTTDYREILAADDIDAVVIATPNYLHHDMVVATLPTGKAIYTEKPLANNLAEARDILRVARETGNGAQISFEMRFCPALQLAQTLLADKRLGEIYTFRACYYRSSYVDPGKPLRWKGSAARSGTGVLADLSSHMVDMVVWLAGMPDRLTAQMRTYIGERPESKGGPLVPVETDDHVIIQAQLPGGAIGTIEAGRLITGTVNEMRLEIYGSEGSLRWKGTNPNYLEVAEKRFPEAEQGGWLAIPTIQSYPGAAIPGADVQVGMFRFHVESIARFLRSTIEGKPYDPGLEQGLRVQAVLEAAEQAARESNWIDVPHE